MKKSFVVVLAVLFVVLGVGGGLPLAEAAMDINNFTYLCGAQSGSPQQVKAAIDGGADVKAKGGEGWTALMSAAAFNNHPEVVEVISILLKAGADIEAREGGRGMERTVLMLAAEKTRNPNVISALLKAGANAKAQDARGNTVLAYANFNRALQGTAALAELQKAAQ
jgi:ankyrin repeat protein